MLKRCSICKLEKSLDRFYRRAVSLDGLQAHCKDCDKIRSRQVYQRHAEEIKAKAAIGKERLRQRNYAFLNEYRSSHPCVDCGESDPEVLDFDHVRGVKIRSVFEMACAATSIKRLVEEIEKCEMRCANCHRRITRKREQEAKAAREALYSRAS